MTELEFKALANQGYNRIPLIIEAIADLDTPLSLYLKLTQQNNGGKNSFLLESVVGGERFGRYSFIGLPASTVLRAHGMKTEVVKNDKVRQSSGLYCRIPVPLQGSHSSRPSPFLRWSGRLLRL